MLSWLGYAPRVSRVCAVQCFWDTTNENEHVAYRLQQSGFQCRRCPIYLPGQTKEDLLGILDEK